MSELHFTYAELNNSELLQGDILSRTPELDAVINEVHPHYTNREYTHFQVITQSCDLVPRKGKCKARYITIAAVRSLEAVITRELEKLAGRKFAIEVEGEVYCSEKVKDELKGFLKKIYNNQSKDFFYLNSAPNYSLESDSCTFLPLSIAIKADLHFQTCLSSKILQLEENFQSRLGWMVGNLYSRVGTKDFVPSGLPNNEEFNKLIDTRLKNHFSWVKEKDFPIYLNNSSEPEVTLKTIESKIEEEKERRVKMGVDEIVRLLKLELKIEPDIEKKFVNRLSSSALLVSRFSKK